MKSLQHKFKSILSKKNVRKKQDKEKIPYIVEDQTVNVTVAHYCKRKMSVS